MHLDLRERLRHLRTPTENACSGTNSRAHIGDSSAGSTGRADLGIPLALVELIQRGWQWRKSRALVGSSSEQPTRRCWRPGMHLGVVPPPRSYDADIWTQQAGPTVSAPFGAEEAEGPYLGESGWGINFRVRVFEGNAVQLWEPV